MKNKKLIIGISIAVGVLVIGSIGGFFIWRNLSEDKTSDNIVVEEMNNENCDVVFTHNFTDISKIDALQPIGSVTGASPGRSYMMVKEGENVPVYAPMDATLTTIIYAYRGPDAPHGEYGFWFDAGCGVTFLLDHLDTISDELAEYAPTEASRSTSPSPNASVEVKAGTLLGYTNGTEMAKTFDFLVLDKNTDIFHVNPERWDWDQANYAVCPYDLFTDDLKNEYYKKIGIIDNTGFVKADSCGNPSHDIAGTISGGWFSEGATMMKGEYLTVGEEYGNVHVMIKNDVEAVSDRVSDYSPKVLPKDVKVGDSVCYYTRDSNIYAFLNLVDDETIQFVTGNSSCPATFPSSNIKTYTR